MAPKESVSQTLGQFIDDGSESASVDLLPNVEGGEPESDAPAEIVKEVKPTETVLEVSPGEKAPDGEVSTKEAVIEDLENKPDETKVTPNAQKRIDKVTKKFRDQERETKSANDKLEEANKKLAEFEKKQAVDDIGVEPDPDDYETEAEYSKDLTKFYVKTSMLKEKQVKDDATEKALTESKEKAEAEASETAATELNTKLHEALYKTAAKYPDFAKVVESVEVPVEILPLFTELDNATDVAYHLGKNPETVERLGEMHPSLAGAAIQKLSTSLKANKTTNAPDPITPVNTSGGNIKTLGELSTEEYRKRRMETINGG